MNRGWVKLHRKILDNEMLWSDTNAFVVFAKLLLLVDRKTGSYRTGRFVFGELMQLKPITAYKVLKRLENAEMVTLRSNNKYTIIHICNWSKYQDDDNTTGNNAVTTREQPGNNAVTHNKKKEVRIKNKENNIVFDELNNYWSEAGGRKLSDNKTARTAVHKLLKEHSVDEIKFAINGAVYYQGVKYKPQVLSFNSLYEKWDSLSGHMVSETKEQESGTARF